LSANNHLPSVKVRGFVIKVIMRKPHKPINEDEQQYIDDKIASMQYSGLSDDVLQRLAAMGLANEYLDQWILHVDNTARNGATQADVIKYTRDLSRIDAILKYRGSNG